MDQAELNPDMLLEELRQAHAALLRAMAELDDMSARPLEDCGSFTKARRRVKHADAAWRQVCGRVYDYLAAADQAATAMATLLSLRGADHDTRVQVDAHVGKWTTEKIRAHWESYCADSHALRWRLRSCVNSEQRWLYPMLEQAHRDRII